MFKKPRVKVILFSLLSLLLLSGCRLPYEDQFEEVFLSRAKIPIYFYLQIPSEDMLKWTTVFVVIAATFVLAWSSTEAGKRRWREGGDNTWMLTAVMFLAVALMPSLSNALSALGNFLSVGVTYDITAATLNWFPWPDDVGFSLLLAVFTTFLLPFIHVAVQVYLLIWGVYSVVIASATFNPKALITWIGAALGWALIPQVYSFILGIMRIIIDNEGSFLTDLILNAAPYNAVYAGFVLGACVTSYLILPFSIRQYLPIAFMVIAADVSRMLAPKGTDGNSPIAPGSAGFNPKMGGSGPNGTGGAGNPGKRHTNRDKLSDMITGAGAAGVLSGIPRSSNEVRTEKNEVVEGEYRYTDPPTTQPEDAKATAGKTDPKKSSQQAGFKNPDFQADAPRDVVDGDYAYVEGPLRELDPEEARKAKRNGKRNKWVKSTPKVPDTDYAAQSPSQSPRSTQNGKSNGTNGTSPATAGRAARVIYSTRRRTSNVDDLSTAFPKRKRRWQEEAD